MTKILSNNPSYTHLALLIGGTLCVLLPSLIILFEFQTLSWLVRDFGASGMLVVAFFGALLLGAYVNATSKNKYAPMLSVAISLVAMMLTFVLSFLSAFSKFGL